MYASARFADSRARLVGERVGVGDGVVDRDGLARVRAPRHVRAQRRGVDARPPCRTRRRRRSTSDAPVVERLLPRLALRRERPALEVRERRVVGRDRARRARRPRSTCCRPSCGLPSRARGSRSRGTRCTEPIPPPVPMRAMIASTMSLAVTPAGSVAVDGDRHRARPHLRQRLRREHVLDLARADAERERAERAVRRGVAVAAHDRHARLREPLLGPDHVHDALAGIAHRVAADAELLAVAARAPRSASPRSGRRAAGRGRRSGRCGPSSRR